MDRITAEEIILQWHERKIPSLLKRNITFRPPAEGRTVAIIGPRRAGKSFFMYDIIINRLNTDRRNTLLLNLEDHRFGIPRSEDLDVLISTYEAMVTENEKRFLFLDEIQNLDGWERFVRSLMDRYDFTIFISGSSSKLLSKEIATSMRGRSISYLIMPFSFIEFLSIKKLKTSRSPRGKSLTLRYLKEYLEYGGFPDVVREDDDHTKRKVLRSYVEAMLFRDVVERHGIKHIKVLKLLMGQMIASTANQLSLNKFNGFLKSQGIRIDKNAIYNYKEHLLDAFGFMELKRIDGSYRTVEQGNPKIYPMDTGYLTDFGHGIDTNIGRSMETCVALELARRHENYPGYGLNFWRENSEVDFVISKDRKVMELIQVSYNIDEGNTREREINGLISASRDLDCDELKILTWDREETIVKDGRSIHIIPLWSWLIDENSDKVYSPKTG